MMANLPIGEPTVRFTAVVMLPDSNDADWPRLRFVLTQRHPTAECHFALQPNWWCAACHCDVSSISQEQKCSAKLKLY